VPEIVCDAFWSLCAEDEKVHAKRVTFPSFNIENVHLMDLVSSLISSTLLKKQVEGKQQLPTVIPCLCNISASKYSQFVCHTNLRKNTETFPGVADLLCLGSGSPCSSPCYSTRAKNQTPIAFGV